VYFYLAVDRRGIVPPGGRYGIGKGPGGRGICALFGFWNLKSRDRTSSFVSHVHLSGNRVNRDLGEFPAASQSSGGGKPKPGRVPCSFDSISILPSASRVHSRIPSIPTPEA
jgi:hypothetical protein